MFCVEAHSSHQRWHQAAPGCSPRDLCHWAGTGAPGHWCSRWFPFARGCADHRSRLLPPYFCEQLVVRHLSASVIGQRLTLWVVKLLVMLFRFHGHTLLKFQMVCCTSLLSGPWLGSDPLHGLPFAGSYRAQDGWRGLLCFGSALEEGAAGVSNAFTLTFVQDDLREASY